jgi:hypothetical protein
VSSFGKHQGSGFAYGTPVAYPAAFLMQKPYALTSMIKNEPDGKKRVQMLARISWPECDLYHHVNGFYIRL